MHRFLMIGFGNMGQAFYQGMLRTLSPEDVFICDKNIEKMKGLPSGNISTDVNKFIDIADIVILAVKPQSFAKTIDKVEYDLSSKVIISMMAGISFESIESITKSKKIMRIMPNLAVEFGEGVVGMVYNFNDDTVLKLRMIFSAMGGVIEVKDEIKLDELSPLSGSGLAYFYYFAEIMKNKGVLLGFSEEEANQMAIQSLIGSASVLKNKKMSPEELRKSVTSKGGLTQAAIENMIAEDLEGLFGRSIDKAVERAHQLSDEATS